MRYTSEKSGEKLREILHSFTPAQVRAFRKFLQSPYFSYTPELEKLLDYMLLDNPSIKEQAKVWKHFYPGKEIEALKWRQLHWRLLELAEKFVCVESALENPQRAVLQYSFRHSLAKNFNIREKEAGRRMQELNWPSSDEMQEKLEFVKVSSRFIEKKGDRTVDPNLQALSDELDRYFLLEKLKIACNILSFSNLRSEAYRIGFWDELLDRSAALVHGEFLPLQAYARVVRLFREPGDEQNFRALVQLLSDSIHIADPSDFRDLLIYARNFCIKAVNTGREDMLEILLDLYRMELEWIGEKKEGSVPPATFENAVVVGLRLGMREFVRNLISRFEDLLPVNAAENIASLAKARLEFEEGNFSESRKWISRIDPSELIIYLNSRVVMAKIFYELEDSEALEALVKNLKSQLVREQKMGYHLELYKNFLSLIGKMTILRDKVPISSKKVKNLQIFIGKGNLMERKWFHVKIEKLRRMIKY